MRQLHWSPLACRSLRAEKSTKQPPIHKLCKGVTGEMTKGVLYMFCREPLNLLRWNMNVCLLCPSLAFLSIWSESSPFNMVTHMEVVEVSPTWNVLFGCRPMIIKSIELIWWYMQLLIHMDTKVWFWWPTHAIFDWIFYGLFIVIDQSRVLFCMGHEWSLLLCTLQFLSSFVSDHGHSHSLGGSHGHSHGLGKVTLQKVKIDIIHVNFSMYYYWSVVIGHTQNLPELTMGQPCTVLL